MAHPHDFEGLYEALEDMFEDIESSDLDVANMEFDVEDDFGPGYDSLAEVKGVELWLSEAQLCSAHVWAGEAGLCAGCLSLMRCPVANEDVLLGVLQDPSPEGQ